MTTVTFAEKLARMPSYQAGVPDGKAPEAVVSEGIAQLASNESPYPPHPDVVDAIARAASAANRYPDPAATLLRRRIAERHETEPARIAVGNGSCELLLAAAEALCEPGAEILFAWPSFSIYPHLAALSGAREVRVPLAPGDVHDLDAMLEEVTAATQLLLVCNPNNPTGTHLGAERVAEFCERVPGNVTVVLDEAYVDFQLHDDPDTTADLLDHFSNLVILRTFSKCHGLAGLRVGYAIGSPDFRAAVDAVPPAVQRQRDRAGGRGGGGPAPGRRRRAGRAHDRRAGIRRGGVARARARISREPDQLLMGGPRRPRRSVDRRGPRLAGDPRAGGRTAGRPRSRSRHLRDPARERALPAGAARRPLAGTEGGPIGP